MARSLETLGQNLFNPPSVKGWDGGPAWLNGQTLLYRQNLSLQLCETRQKDPGAADSSALPVRLLKGQPQDKSLNPVDFFLAVFLQNDVPVETRQKLREFLGKVDEAKYPNYWSAERRSEHKIISLCHLVLTLPEWQLN